ncbi:MAG TPA: purine-nucleoside phosphorylase [Anaeromyxobacteraceae bacterium]|nr:purine-nucleoside phosphorylase [Anaeromyxobacteraceae bacterium]
MSKKADLHTRLSYALAWVRGKTDLAPRVGVVLGSGLSAFAERLASATAIPYQEIPEFPVAAVEGHPGHLVVGELPSPGGAVPVAVMQGRVHVYEGWNAEDAAFGTRLLCRLGVRALLLTNASGAVNPALAPGDLVRLTDHLNLSGSNPLTGPNDPRLGPRFVDMQDAYHPGLGEVLEAAAGRVGVALKRGVYACVAGPSYETPAEIRMLRALGADLVGMSTVPEVIAARHMGVRVCAVAAVSNLAAGIGAGPLSHDEVTAAGERVREPLGRLLSAVIPDLAR